MTGPLCLARSATASPPAAVLPEVHAAFAAALAAAEAEEGATSPNPPVGCAALDACGKILAVEAHRRAGQPHAEPLALQRCRDLGVLEQVKTLAVTLEPCNHYGRTPPCTAAILAAGVAEVWVGALDPDPRVGGAGIAALLAAGVCVRRLDVEADARSRELAAACRRLIAPFVKALRTGRPWVTVKQALDVEGSMIPPPGAKTFTSPASLQLAHDLRRRADALLTGIGTVLADWPEFTVRHVPDHAGRRRLLIVADRQGRTPEDYAAAATLRGFDLRRVGGPEEALDVAGAAGALRLLVEAGPRLTASVLAEGLWDEHVIIRQGGPCRPDTVETLLAP